MPGGRGTEKRAMSSAVLVRLPAELAAAVEARARATDLTAAAWLRALAVAAAGAPVEDARPSRPPEPPSPDVAELGRLTGAVGKATGAAVQLAKAAREAGAAAFHGEAEAVLAEYRVLAADLTRATNRARAAARRRRRE